MTTTKIDLKVRERTGGPLLLIVFVALAVRLLFVALVYQDQLDPRLDHWAFGYETGRIARSIAHGQGFANPLFQKTGPTAWMTPVYPYLVAGVFKLFGVYSKGSALVLLSLNSLFSALTCVPVFFMTRESFEGKTAVWAGWVWALFPYSIYLAVSWIWETSLTTLLLSCLFLLTLRLQRSTKLTAWAGYGLLWGATALTNPAILSLLPLLAGWACYRLHRRGQRWGRQASITLLALIIVVTPWFARNYRTFHRVIPFRDNFWLELHVGNNGDTSHWSPDSGHPSSSVIEEEQYNRLGELNYMAKKKQEVIEFITRHPSSFVLATFRRFVFAWTGYWSLSREYLAREPADLWNVLMNLILLTFTLLGVRRIFEEENSTAVPYVFALTAFPMVYYVTHPQISYRHPIDPQIVVLATYGAMGLVQAWKSKQSVASPARQQG